MTLDISPSRATRGEAPATAHSGVGPNMNGDGTGLVLCRVSPSSAPTP